MTSPLVRFGMLAALAILTGCAPGAPPRDAVIANRGGGPDVITFEEVQASAQAEALGVVMSLRPEWLRARSAVGTLGSVSRNDPEYPEAFVDGAWLGPIDELRRIQAQTVERIEFTEGRDATTRYGADYLGGVIHVYTRRQ
jgi:hypothetical protein